MSRVSRAGLEKVALRPGGVSGFSEYGGGWVSIAMGRLVDYDVHVPLLVWRSLAIERRGIIGVATFA